MNKSELTMLILVILVGVGVAVFTRLPPIVTILDPDTSATAEPDIIDIEDDPDWSYKEATKAPSTYINLDEFCAIYCTDRMEEQYPDVELLPTID